MPHETSPRTDKPSDPPCPGGESELPVDQDPRESGDDIKEPPLPGTAGSKQNFLRRGYL
jgi:hypothetical protein